jgi:hypothetical protein
VEFFFTKFHVCVLVRMCRSGKSWKKLKNNKNFFKLFLLNLTIFQGLKYEQFFKF